MAPLQTGAMNVTSLHIALVSETFPPEVNGVANTLGRLCQGLRERGHRLQLVRPRQADDTAPNDDQLLLTRGWPLPGYAGLQWGQSSLHKLLQPLVRRVHPYKLVGGVAAGAIRIRIGRAAGLLA